MQGLLRGVVVAAGLKPPRAGRCARLVILMAVCFIPHLAWALAVERPEVRYFHDAEGSLDVAGARAVWAAGRFAGPPPPGDNYGFRPGATWFAFGLQNPQGRPVERLVVIEYTLIDRFELYRLDQASAGPLWIGGDLQPFGARSLPIRYFNRSVELAPYERVTFLLRVASQSSMQVPVVVAEADHYLASQQSSLLGFGLYFGVLAALLILNSILFVSLRDRNFLYYVAYVLSVGLMLLCLSGIGFQLFWPDSPRLGNWLVLISMSLSLASMLQFARAFLDLRRRFPLGDRLCLALIALSLIGIAATFVLPYSQVVLPLTLLVFPVAVLVYACGLAVLRSYPPARYFLIAWTTLLLGIMLYAAVALGWVPRVFFTEYAIQLGSAVEMILLSFALAYRINLLTATTAQLEGEARGQLERRVRERTDDLDAALRRLETANRQLEDFSRRDGLTGCFNRRSFEHILRRWEQQRNGDGRDFSVLMIDIDEFKQVNDRYGHLVGDDCLRHVAQLLEGPVADAGGQLCRYGGEEFVAVAPLSQPDQAQALAERLRARTADRTLISEGRHIPVTISVGIALREQAASALDTVRRADEALYRAKALGRNRCELATG
ncbi:sensor domain-containing diguanylate cyclase [Pseudomarimonas salicorniae]|uniref:diguanylate cyclase n=1 Tax=Pseudomarimonas salicorniae TaxID=2933270 RepID=A0ABT0GJL8_9GAMM|nr:diguanylate cyclase [Lysobacter sp. CAU 1642]MCK7594730.1 sensor domain-containing diguanylate cyclase [Lysobacter sp. CAU 1642]